jgi:hypothetical protein
MDSRGGADGASRQAQIQMSDWTGRLSSRTVITGVSLVNPVFDPCI